MAQSARKPATHKKKGTQPFYYVLGGLAVLGLLAIAFTVLRSQGGGAALEPVSLEGLTNEQLVERAQGVELGPDNAPVKMLIFIDFMCPACAAFTAQIEPQLKSEFVEPGKLQMVVYDFPLGGSHVHSFLAARAARCAGDQNKFWDYHNLLFARLSEWGTSSSPPVDRFVGYAGELGLNQGDFESCVKSDKHQDVVTAGRMLGDALGVGGTPTVIVNSKRVNANIAMDMNSLRDLINSELGTP